MKRYTETETKNIIIDYQNGFPVKYIGSKYQRDVGDIRKLLKRNGVFVSSLNLYTNDELNCLIKDYKDGMALKDLSKKYNRSPSSITVKLK